MKTILCQTNPIIGDIVGNFLQIKNIVLRNSDSAKGALFIFPELSLTGYPPNDLILRRGFVEEQLEYIEEVRKLSAQHECGIIVGAVTKTGGNGKKPFHNTALTFFNGAEVGRYHKQLLPTYNIFDESRYFEAGSSDQNSCVEINGEKFAVLICEDCWNDPAVESNRLYAVNPIASALKSNEGKRIDFVVTINASPSDIGKYQRRFDMYSKLCKTYKTTFIYVNCVGGQDSLVFDGYSFACFFNKNLGPKICSLSGYLSDETSIYVGADENKITICENVEIKSEYHHVYEHLRLGLGDYMRKSGFKKVVVGSSGGIDSALVLTIAAHTLGAENVYAVTMPSKFSSEGSVKDSEALCKNLGVKLFYRNIEEEVLLSIAKFRQSFECEPSKLAIENMQARIRGRILMEYSNTTGAIVLSTGNKSEVSCGYFTLYGDSNGGLALISDVYKTEVFALCKEINKTAGFDLIPSNIVNKAPSAELWENQKDTDSLPPYEILDPLLKLFIEGDMMSYAERKELISQISGLSLKEVNRVLSMVDKCEFKRFQLPPTIRIHKRAWGSGRQIPIVKKVDGNYMFSIV